MSRESAVLAALDLFRTPSLSAVLRQREIPDDALLVMQAAAGDPSILAQLSKQTGLSKKILRDACAFYLQRVLLFPTANHYRVLGANPGADREQLRSRMRWLLLWLHPDHNRNEWQAAYARRVIEAWKAVSNPRDLTLPASTIAAQPSRYVPTWVKHPVVRPSSKFFVWRTCRASLRVLALSTAVYLFGPDFVGIAVGACAPDIPSWNLA